MKPDPIVEEVRRVRQEHAARYGNDIHRIFEALRENQKNPTVRWSTSAPGNCWAGGSSFMLPRTALSTKRRVDEEGLTAGNFYLTDHPIPHTVS